jgi:hypothetical protein
MILASGDSPMPRALQNAIKMAVAAVLALAAHESLPWPDQTRFAWSVVSAMVVMQSNVGSSVGASWTRLVGTFVGALLGAVVVGLLGIHATFLGVAVAVALTVLVCHWLNITDSVRLACVTLIVVLVSSRPDVPAWRIGLERFLDIAIGIVAALVTQLLIFPQLAGGELRKSVAQTLAKCGELLRRVSDAYLLRRDRPVQRDPLLVELRGLLRRNLNLLVDLSNEPGSLRPDRSLVIGLVDKVEEIAEGLLSLDDALCDLRQGAYVPQLAPEMAALCRNAADALAWAKAKIQGETPEKPMANLHLLLRALDDRFVHLSEQGISRYFAPVEVLHFCAFLFTLRSVVEQVIQLVDEIRQGKAPTVPERWQKAEQLIEAYRRTDYSVEGPSGRFVLHVDQKSAELDAVLTRHHVLNWAYLTACNPASARLTEKENEARQASLEADVARAGFAFYRGAGEAKDGSWPPEPSVLVPGLPRDEALRLARQYGQNALLYGVAGGTAQLLWV